MFEKNDVVLYGTHGVCRIQDLTEREFAGTTKTYYVLAPVYDPASVIYVPVDSPKLVGKMRRLASREEIVSQFHGTSGEESLWIEDEPQRRLVYGQILEKGERCQLIRMIRALYLHQKKQQSKGRRLHMADEQFLRDAEKLIEDEIAYVFDLRREEVVPFIQRELA